MSGWKKLAAAPAASDEVLNVDNVFRSYLYEGNGSSNIGITNNIALADGVGGGTSTEFDGNSDYLLRTTDLSNTQGSKTFTVSFWVYDNIGKAGTSRAIYYIFDGSTYYSFQVYFLSTNGYLSIRGRNSSGTLILNQSITTAVRKKDQWLHVLMSFDLSDSSKRHYSVNDVVGTPSNTTYTNDTIAFSNGSPQHSVAGSFTGSTLHDGKLAHFYMDYTYRDLTVESNRRLFIDANGGSTSPSTLSALNPVIYLPMTADYSVGENIGTGGDLTAYGSPTIVNSGTEYLSGVGQGGMVWYRRRDAGENHSIEDTERGLDKVIYTDSTNAEADPGAYGLQAYNADGFIAGYDTSGGDYASWTFRKTPKFFDIQTWTGNGTAGRTISHNLNCDVGMIWVKRRDSTGNWRVWARADASTAYALFLNGASAGTTPPQAAIFGNGTSYVAPTSTEFTIGSAADLNASGGTYVAYIFAHNDGDGGFGPNADQDIIKCGSYTGTGTESILNVIDVGFHPQFLIIKRLTGGTDDWSMMDDMRGFYEAQYTNDNGLTRILQPNSATAEFNDSLVYPRPNGFALTNNSSKANANGSKYFYMAINSRPTTPPTFSSEVFDVITQTPDQNLNGTFIEPSISPIGQVDMNILGQRSRNGLPNTYLWDRRRGSRYFWETNRNVDESNRGATYRIFDDSSSGFLDNFSYPSGSVTNNMIYWMWQRRATFLDIITYTGAGTNGQRINHGLGAVPAMIWIKKRGTASDWAVWHKELNGGVNAEDYHLHLNTSAPENTGNEFGQYNSYYPTETDFEVGSSALTNDTNYQFVAYLFGEIDGVTKMGRYTGNGSSLTVDCGFSKGAKFVLIKCTTSTNGAQWCALDTARGITAGNDPVLQLNTTNAELSIDCMDPSNSGFTVVQEANRNLNRNNDEYVYYAIATP
jgi:hypothetical protein